MILLIPNKCPFKKITHFLEIKLKSPNKEKKKITHFINPQMFP